MPKRNRPFQNKQKAKRRRATSGSWGRNIIGRTSISSAFFFEKRGGVSLSVENTHRSCCHVRPSKTTKRPHAPMWPRQSVRRKHTSVPSRPCSHVRPLKNLSVPGRPFFTTYYMKQCFIEASICSLSLRQRATYVEFIALFFLFGFRFFFRNSLFVVFEKLSNARMKGRGGQSFAKPLHLMEKRERAK